jgi:SAM-dependent methyltransferase/alpha-beta hydrolase superfamily lysophospholipase
MLAEILWAVPDTGVVAEAREQDPPPFRVGLRFLHTDRHSEQRMRDVMARLLPNGDSEIVTVAAECSNDAGQRLAIAHDHPRKALPPGSPVVIISPGFGETKRAWVGLAHWLCVNGFHVLRYDHTCHVGDSDGPMERTTLSGMQQDLRAVLDLAERLLPASPLAVIGHNLSGRVALKVASTDPRIKLLFLLAGVVDVQSTLMAVHQDDLVTGYRSGARLGRANLLGFTIDADRWLGDATGGRFCSMDDTLADAERMQAPVIFLAAEKDPWVPLEQLKAVQSALRSNRRHLSLLVGSPSRLRDNPRTARAFFRQIAACCIERFYPLTPKGQVLPADPAPAARQAERERIRSRQRHSLAKPDLVDFWQIYLDHFQTAARSSEFWRLYDHLYRLLGTTDKGGTILDAGCGHGVFGMLLSLNHAYRHRTAAEGTPWSTTYVGLDVVSAALQHASRQLALVADEVRQKFPTTRYPHVLVRSALMAGDLDQPLPFRDGQFDRIVCNLTLSFLRDPVSTLRELMRTLTPGGRLVVSLFTPHADLSAVFATVMQRATGAEEIEEAKWLWTQWGLIREAEANGAFRFFDRPEAIRLFKACGAPRPRLYPALADQALIVVAEKSMR